MRVDDELQLQSGVECGEREDARRQAARAQQRDQRDEERERKRAERQEFSGEGRSERDDEMRDHEPQRPVRRSRNGRSPTRIDQRKIARKRDVRRRVRRRAEQAVPDVCIRVRAEKHGRGPREQKHRAGSCNDGSADARAIKARQRDTCTAPSAIVEAVTKSPGGGIAGTSGIGHGCFCAASRIIKSCAA